MMKYSSIACLVLLSGCVSNWDMQGHDPKDYYAEHPIKNQLETRNISARVHFNSKEQRLSGDEIDKLRADLHGISPMAAESIVVQAMPLDMKNEARKQSMTKLLRSMGYTKPKIKFIQSPLLGRDTMEVDITYMTVVLPDCPDWRMSPVTTYSNTHQGNFKCAHETNLGLMVADPHDLVRGTGEAVTPDSERSSIVLQQYRSGKSFGAPAPSSSESSSGASSSESSSESSGQ